VSDTSERAQRLRDLAREARLHALQARSAKDRISVLNLADEYDRMARESEAVEATKKIMQRAVAPGSG
jgi:hypothetical protein